VRKVCVGMTRMSGSCAVRRVAVLTLGRVAAGRPGVQKVRGWPGGEALWGAGMRLARRLLDRGVC
jgi:hypothetical protein